MAFKVEKSKIHNFIVCREGIIKKRDLFSSRVTPRRKDEHRTEVSIYIILISPI